MNDFMIDRIERELEQLKANHNFRTLPRISHEGRQVKKRPVETMDRFGNELLCDEKDALLNLSSNDYLGLAAEKELRDSFFSTLKDEKRRLSASSSRLLTGNYTVYEELESELAALYGSESSLVFNSGYHANMGILPALADAKTLILADKLVHASLIDGIRLSAASFIRYRHNHYEQLERLVEENHLRFDTIIIVTESIFSMDGDTADLSRLVALKKNYSNVLLYVDEAHAFGVRGKTGLGCAQEQECIGEIDFLVGTFGKALASVGAFVICTLRVREYLINRMRTLIFTTALPPVSLEWTLFLVRKLPEFSDRRRKLSLLSSYLREQIREKGYDCPSSSHIVPWMTGESALAVHWSLEMQKKGFYALPVRPPTVPEGTSRIRISLTASVSRDELKRFISVIPTKSLL